MMLVLAQGVVQAVHGGDWDGIATPGDEGIGGDNAQWIRVPPPKDWGIYESGVAGGTPWTVLLHGRIHLGTPVVLVVVPWLVWLHLPSRDNYRYRIWRRIRGIEGPWTRRVAAIDPDIDAGWCLVAPVGDGASVCGHGGA
ncbi:hypothetical protein EDD85DRAFT_792566 [Armillaria nabsnona]|nr:hypothetical protein EDD85DRAFT_792566 [Armillaria nabsnona]